MADTSGPCWDDTDGQRLRVDTGWLTGGTWPYTFTGGATETEVTLQMPAASATVSGGTQIQHPVCLIAIGMGGYFVQELIRGGFPWTFPFSDEERTYTNTESGTTISVQRLNQLRHPLRAARAPRSG